MMKTMKLRFLTTVIICMSLIGCVPKSDYEKLKSELEQTKQELSVIRQKYDELIQEKRQAEIERNKTPYVSEAQALQYIKDYFNFYDKDTKYRNVELRRTADNIFKVSIETCTKKGSFSGNDFFWRSDVRTLTVYSDGKYDF